MAELWNNSLTPLAPLRHPQPGKGSNTPKTTIVTTTNSPESFWLGPFIIQMTDQTQRGPESDLFKAARLVNGSEQIQTNVLPALELEFAIIALHCFLE